MNPGDSRRTKFPSWARKHMLLFIPTNKWETIWIPRQTACCCSFHVYVPCPQGGQRTPRFLIMMLLQQPRITRKNAHGILFSCTLWKLEPMWQKTNCVFSVSNLFWWFSQNLLITQRGHFSKVVLTFEDLPKLLLWLWATTSFRSSKNIFPHHQQQHQQQLGPLIDLTAIAAGKNQLCLQRTKEIGRRKILKRTQQLSCPPPRFPGVFSFSPPPSFPCPIQKEEGTNHGVTSKEEKIRRIRGRMCVRGKGGY